MAHPTNPKTSRQSGLRHVKKIVAATTLGESSDHVVVSGRTLARATGAELYLLHAYALVPLHYGSMGMTAVFPDNMQSEHERVRQQLDAQLERLGIDDGEIAGKILQIGTPHRLLIEAVQEIDADLILVGASETKGALAPLLGSTADRVLRQASVPVWVLRDPLRLPLQHVVAPTDLSDLSEDSLRRGLALIDETSGERPRLDTLFVLSHVERMGSVQFSPEQIERFAHEELDRSNKALADDTGWDAVSHLRTGLPRQQILSEIKDGNPDLVVLGTHGRSGFERLLMGSVAADVVRQAPCNVLVVPPAEAREIERPQEAIADKALRDLPVDAAVH